MKISAGVANQDLVAGIATGNFRRGSGNIRPVTYRIIYKNCEDIEDCMDYEDHVNIKNCLDYENHVDIE